MEIKFTGLNAVIGLVLLALFIGYKYTTAVTTIDTGGKQAIKEWIAYGYQRYHLARTDISPKEKAAILLKSKPQNIEFSTMTVRGNLESLSVHVIIKSNNAHPPDEPYEKYFKLKYSITNGWEHVGDISKLQYYMSIF